MMRPWYLRLAIAWSIGTVSSWAVAAQAANAPVQIAQSSDDELLVEEPATQAPPASVKKDPPRAQPTPNVPTPAPKSATPPPLRKAAPAPTKNTDAGMMDLLIEEGEAPAAQEASPASDTSADVSSSPRIDSVAGPAPAGSVASDSTSGKAIEDGGLVEEPVPSDKLKLPPPTVQKAKPAIVTDGQSINFAENLKGYRSPKLAMLMSLLVPGAGQAYSKRYWKVPVFLAVEAGIIATSIAFHNKGKDYEKKAHTYADANYSTDSFSVNYTKLRNAIAVGSGKGEVFADSVLKEIYGWKSYWTEAGFDTAYFARIARSKSSDFYDDLQDRGGSNLFVQGWKDAYPNPGQSDLEEQIRNPDTAYISPGRDTVILPVAATSFEVSFKYEMFVKTVSTGDPSYGFSAYYTYYSSLLGKRDDNYDYARNWLFALILNHLVSAIDAGLTAKAYNDRLMGKQSFWQHIRVSPMWVDAASGPAPGAVVSVDF